MLGFTKKYHKKRTTLWLDFVLGVIFIAYFLFVEIICTSKMNCSNTVKYIVDAVEILIGISVILYLFTIISISFKKEKDSKYKNNKFEALMEKVGPISITVGIVWMSVLLIILN